MKLCILAAGKGSRLYGRSLLPKCLLPVQNKAVLSHLIEKVSAATPIVIGVGYRKDLVIEYCKTVHGDRNLTFIDVDNYDGIGSGPGYSLSCCRHELQEPFYLACSDCFFTEPLPSLSYNWLGVHKIDNPAPWATVKVDKNLIVDLKNKDAQGYEYAWIGLAGILDYELFWQRLHAGTGEFEIVSAFPFPAPYSLKAEQFIWFDTGTVQNYDRTKAVFGGSLAMEKEIDEFTYCIEDCCVKVFGNPNIARGRILRADLLKGLVPSLTNTGICSYAYRWIDGKTLYEWNDEKLFCGILDWCQENLWETCENPSFQEDCRNFYKHKTYDRYCQYCEITGDRDKKVSELLGKIKWEGLRHLPSIRWHGDLQYDNVIWDGSRYWLIDWRDSFAGSTVGDVYYDLAKLQAGIQLSFYAVKNGEFTTNNETYSCPAVMPEVGKHFRSWVGFHNYDLPTIDTMTALVYLNMAPLHVPPVNKLLFLHAKYLLSHDPSL